MRIPRRLPTYPYGDNEQLYFGWSNDVGIYWNGTNLVFAPLIGANMSIYFDAGATRIYGGVAAADDLFLHATRNDPRPNITLYGGGNMRLSTQAGDNIEFFDNVTRGLTIGYAANVTTIHGPGVAGDDFELEANSAEAGAAIILEGLGDVALNPAAGSFVKFGAHVGTGDVVSNGHILIEDSAGAQRKLMVTA